MSCVTHTHEPVTRVALSDSEVNQVALVDEPLFLVSLEHSAVTTITTEED